MMRDNDNDLPSPPFTIDGDCPPAPPQWATSAHHPQMATSNHHHHDSNIAGNVCPPAPLQWSMSAHHLQTLMSTHHQQRTPTMRDDEEDLPSPPSTIDSNCPPAPPQWATSGPPPTDGDEQPASPLLKHNGRPTPTSTTTTGHECPPPMNIDERTPSPTQTTMGDECARYMPGGLSGRGKRGQEPQATSC